MFVFFTNSSLTMFEAGHFDLFHLLLVTDDIDWFYIESLCKNIRYVFKFLSVTFLILHFFCFTLRTFKHVADRGIVGFWSGGVHLPDLSKSSFL